MLLSIEYRDNRRTAGKVNPASQGMDIMNFESGMVSKLSRFIVAARRGRRLLGPLIACLALLLGGPEAYAACTKTKTLPDTVINLPATITVPPDTPNGTVVAESDHVPVVGAIPGQFATCTGGGTLSWALVAGSNVAGRMGSTSVPGIGYIAYNAISGVTGSGDTLDQQYSISGTDAPPSFGANGAVVMVQLVKTGPITPGSLTLNPTGPGVLGRVGSFFAGSQAVYNVKVAGTTSVISPTCTVTTTSPKVTLDPIKPSALTGIGSTAGGAALPLRLNCSGSGSQIFITLTDNTDPTNTSNQLSLKPGSTASGVKLQVLNPAGTPVAFGPDSSAKGNKNQWKVGATSAGTINIPLTARYIQSGSPVKPGTVNGVATFTMSYQ
jgi:type 1 fimbria pilin